MRIFDCFMYFDEEIVLDTRLNYLDPYVDYFVIIESCYTHRGDKRELKFDIKKYEKFKKNVCRFPNGSYVKFFGEPCSC